MVATYPVFLKHTHIGKATQAQPYTARAHSRYVQRQSATHSVHVHLMPDNYQARQRWFYDQENGLRKNGRVIDKLTITVPYGVSEFDAAQTLMAFGRSLGDSRCPFMFTLQGFDTNNHHAHFIFVDRDYETGKRVYGTTDRNSTRGIKLEWERVANEMFEELGYDIRVKVKDWQEEQANDNQLESPAEPDNLPEQHHIADAGKMIEPDHIADAGNMVDTVSEDAREGEDNVAYPAHIAFGDDFSREPPKVQIQILHNCITEINRINDAMARLQEAQQRYESLVAQRDEAKFQASIHFVQLQDSAKNLHQAEIRLSQHVKDNGKLKGLGVQFEVAGFNFSFKTKSRKEAEQVQRMYERTKFAVEHGEKTQQGYEHNAAVKAAEAEAAEREALMRKNQLEALYGTERDIKASLDYSEETARMVIQNVTVEQAVEALFHDEITTDEFKAYLEASGNEAVLEAYKDVMEAKEKEQDEGLEL